MNAQIRFLDGTFALIHIPLSLYPTFLQAILRTLLPPSLPTSSSDLDSSLHSLSLLDSHHAFLNISVTPIEVSIVCHTSLATTLFDPAIASLPKDARRSVSTSKDSYAVFSVISAGMDAGSRVVDLTSPLALAGVPIFFITTYYSDFILVPTKDRESVVTALLARGFVFSEDESSFKSPGQIQHNRGHSAGSSSHSDHPPPSTPPPTNVADLQVRAFETLKKRDVVPYIVPDLQLIQCSGRENPRKSGYGHQRPGLSRTMTGNGHNNPPSWVDTVDTKLYTALVSALVSQPQFLSITLAQDDAPSLLLDRNLLPVFGDSLVGDTEGNLVPIFLDLVSLPFEATGIVSGVAGKLVQEMQISESAELSYLSTARAGAVILSAEQSRRALEILRPLLAKEE
ncbi:ACT domain-containing protein [Coniochaeta sp. 2T2.1]|nr:ACT domain-containing protein [Coniochaeta sp. 2T2.1]